MIKKYIRNAGGGGGAATSLAPGCTGVDLTLTANVVAARHLASASGSAAAPAFGNANDEGEGMFFGTNITRLAAGGVETLRSGAASFDPQVAFATGGGIPVSVGGPATFNQAVRYDFEAEKTADYAVGGTDNGIIMNGVGLTLTMMATPVADTSLKVKNRDSGNLTVAGNGNNIDGAASHVLAGGAAAEFYFTGTEWVVL